MSSLWVCCCPSYLSYLTLPYWGFDKKEHTGHLIIRKSLAVDTQQIFQELYRAHFPIQTMKIYSDYPISKYAEANDTVGFYCRPEQNDEKHFSKHAYGIAIDINPLTNPYVYQGTVWPESASQYLKRDANIPGLITVDSVAFKIFTEHGYEWGGLWTSEQDYMHFQKIYGNYYVVEKLRYLTPDEKINFK